MTAIKLLSDVRGAGAVLSARGERLAFDAPAGTMTPSLTTRLNACKPELLALLRENYLEAAMALTSRIADPDEHEELLDWFNERAAIFEYEGNMSRGEAERHAYFALAHAIEEEHTQPPAVAADRMTIWDRMNLTRTQQRMIRGTPLERLQEKANNTI